MDQSQFVDYVLDFYGPGGLYDLKATRPEVLEACLIRLTDPRFASTPWDGDSTDREMVRDIMLERRAA